MGNAFKTLRLTGVIALLVGFMAVCASAAQAEGTWLSNGVTITGNTPINAKVDKEFILLTKVGFAKVEILCTEMKLVGATLQVGGLGSGKAHFQGCITLLNGVPQAKCPPHSPGAAHGLIETNALDGSLRLNAGVEFYEVLSTIAGVPIVDLLLGLGECAIGNLCEIAGKMFLKDAQGESLVDKREHLFEEEPTLSSLSFCGNAARVDGSAFGFLPSGSTFAGHV